VTVTTSCGKSERSLGSRDKCQWFYCHLLIYRSSGRTLNRDDLFGETGSFPILER
jgi:hypothetical protein